MLAAILGIRRGSAAEAKARVAAAVAADRASGVDLEGVRRAVAQAVGRHADVRVSLEASGRRTVVVVRAEILS